MKKSLAFHLFLVIFVSIPATAIASDELVLESREVLSAKEEGRSVDDLIAEKLDAACLNHKDATPESKVIRDSFKDKKEYVYQNLTRNGQTYVVVGENKYVLDQVKELGDKEITKQEYEENELKKRNGDKSFNPFYKIKVTAVPHIIIKDYKCSNLKTTVQKFKESLVVQKIAAIFKKKPADTSVVASPLSLAQALEASQPELNPDAAPFVPSASAIEPTTNPSISALDPLSRSAAHAKVSALNPKAISYVPSVLNPKAATFVPLNSAARPFVPSQRALAKNTAHLHEEAEDVGELVESVRELTETAEKYKEYGLKTLELQARVSRINNRLLKTNPAALTQFYQGIDQANPVQNYSGSAK